MAGKMAEVKNCCARRWGSWFRTSLVAGAVVAIVIVILLTAYLVIPEWAISRGLAYVSYADARALTDSLDEFSDMRRPGRAFAQSGFASGMPHPLDLGRRYILFTNPHTNPDAGPTAFAIFDTEKEEFLGSWRLSHPTHDFIGFHTETSCSSKQARDPTPASLFWSMQCSAEIPKWWPLRNRWGNNGKLTRSEFLRFDTRSLRWEFVVHEPIEVLNTPAEHWLSRLNRPLALPETDDEVIAEHAMEDRDRFRPAIQRLVRRSRMDATIRWEISADAFPALGGQASICWIRLPVGPLETPIDWCHIIHDGIEGQFMLNSEFWRLDLATGEITKLSVPSSGTPDGPEVASDGQTLVYRDNGNVLVRSAYGGSGSNPSGKKTTDLVAWHPDMSQQVLFQNKGMSGFDCHIVLPRGRVLFQDAGGYDDELKVYVTPIHEAKKRLVYERLHLD